MQFTDVNYRETHWYQDNSDLIITSLQSGDSVRIKYFLGHDSYKIETFVFQDLTFRFADLKNIRFTEYGTDSNDDISLYAWQYKADIYGGLGNDTIRVVDKDNLLDGGEGDDRLYGGSGADTLIGGSGNDYLAGGYGGDIYLFAQGHGQDTVCDYDSKTVKDNDTIQFTDINYGETRWHQDSDDLIVTHQQSGDSVRIQYFFSSNYYQSSCYEIETFVFQDKTFTMAQMREMGLNLHGTDGDDVINMTSWQYKINIYGG
ncbi:calcium-binding protein, partial [Stenoxybacter acetivorans]|uniref:calcium-binding protein n=1 Tax=Stenoxybacter acetivorans TaxID=422441 RepID=UPI003CCC2934